MKTVEFLLYTLKPGTGKDFHRIIAYSDDSGQ